MMIKSVQKNEGEETIIPLFSQFEEKLKNDEKPLLETKALRLFDQLYYTLSIYNDRIVAEGDQKEICLCIEREIVFWTEPQALKVWIKHEENNMKESFLFEQQLELEQFQETLKTRCPQQGFFLHYDLLEQIGEGKKSKVYKVVRKKDQNIFACKIQQNSSSFLREISILRELQHPNIATFHELFIETDQTTYSIFDYEDGGDLLSLLQKKENKNEIGHRQKIKMMMDLLHGLEYLRIKGIIHRDIKPENILYSRKDQNYKIADFGFARRVGDKTEKISGTPGYIAPQLIQKQTNELSFKSDIYSMGVVFFEILTGKQFYCGKNPEQIINKNQQGWSWKKRQKQMAEINSIEKDLVNKMLRSSPENRKNTDEILSGSCFKKLKKLYADLSHRSQSTKSSKQSDENSSSQQQNSLILAVKRIFNRKST